VSSVPHVQLTTLYGVPLLVRWYVLAAILLLTLYGLAEPTALFALAGWLGMILIHEAGHALAAHRAGFDVASIELGIIHGRCHYLHFGISSGVQAWIALAGPLAQVAVAIPVILIADALPRVPPAVEPLLVFLGPSAILMAAFNLIPFPGLDGEVVWAEVRRRLWGPQKSASDRALEEMNRALTHKKRKERKKGKKGKKGGDNVRPIR